MGLNITRGMPRAQEPTSLNDLIEVERTTTVKPVVGNDVSSAMSHNTSQQRVSIC
jgi:hypothetical protein